MLADVCRVPWKNRNVSGAPDLQGEGDFGIRDLLGARQSVLLQDVFVVYIC